MAIRSFREASRNNIPINIEYRVIYPDGSIHWLMSRGKPICATNGIADRYVGTIIDITDRKLMEQELVENETRFNFALEASNAGVWEWDIHADTVIWSERVWALYGLEPRSLPASHKLCESTVHPDDRDNTFQSVMAAASKEIEINIEYRVCHKDGSIHWLMCRGMPRRDAAGKLTSYIGTVIDTTSRKQAEEELRKNRIQLDFVLDKSNVGVWELNLTDQTLFRTPEHARIFGYDYDTITGNWSLDKFLHHVVTEEREKTETLIRQSIEQGHNYEFECRIRRIDGKIRWISVSGSVHRDGNKKVVGISGIVQDITHRKKTELLLKESELKFRSIFDYAPLAISISEIKSGRTLDINDAGLELFGHSRDDALHRTASELGIYVNSDEREQIVSVLNNFGRVHNRPVQLRKRTGEQINVLYSAELITLDDCSVLLVMMTDVTLQEVQQQNINQLEQAVAERTEQLLEEWSARIDSSA